MKNLPTCGLGLILAACTTTAPTGSAAVETRAPAPLDAATAWLLRAEQQQFDGDVDAARDGFANAIQLADDALRADPLSAAAHRVRGRALLRQYPQAELGAALAEFERARELAADPAEQQRAADLSELTSGLLAWLDRRPTDALAAWERIHDPNLRDSIGAEIEALQSDVALVEFTVR